MSDRKRLITDLRVIDLRAELEKRNLDKSGVRGVLIQRLSKYLEDEGHDPATYRFDLSAESKGTPAKRTRRSGSTAEAEGEETPTIEGMIVQDDAGEDDEPETSQQTTTPDAVTTVASDTEADAATATAAAATNRKREHQKEPEEIEPKKPCLEKIEVEIKLENNCDTEDSINLDIGDDELLNEETDTAIKIKKDVDAGNEDSSEAACNEAAPDGSAATFDSTTGDQQVNAEAAATSNDDEKPDIDQKDGEKKDKKDEGKEGGARNLWVSGLSGDTRAKDLKQLCSKHGKVIGAKVVTNARTPGSRCYGYVTMASSHDAENCIKNLHRTELHGRMISVEKAKSESAKSESESALRRQPWRSDRRSSKDHKEDPKESDDTRDEKKDFKKESGEGSRSASRSREKSHRSDKERPRRSTRSRERRREALSFSKVWGGDHDPQRRRQSYYQQGNRQKERDVQRARERSRMVAREAERRRREVEESLRERERRQRQEKHRLALEREKLRAEREKIEREKNELLRLERERHRLEREKLELERLELKRAQLRLEEERRKRGYESSSYRKPAASPPPPEPAYDRERHKRAPPPPLTSNRAQFEAPPPPRFEMTSSYDRGTEKRDRDYKRDYPRHVSSGNMKYPSNGNANEETRQPMPPGTRPKEPSRYDARDSRSYRPSPPGKPEPRSWNASSRYPDSAPASKGGSGSGEPWAGAEARYGGTYEARYQPAYQPPPPGAPYPDRYAPARDYRKY